VIPLPYLPPTVAEHAAAAVACQADGHAPRAVLVADMSRPDREPRLWAFDLSDPKHPQVVLQAKVEHGYGSSDPKNPEMATRFSDVENSGMTSLGLYRVADAYTGKNGASYRLQGLSATNAHAWDRDIDLHPSQFVTPTSISHSAGCTAVAAATLVALTRHFGTLTGALMWVDGPGVHAPTCASLQPWPAVKSGWWSAPRACTT